MVICATYLETQNPRYIACDTWEQALAKAQDSGHTLLSLLLLTQGEELPPEPVASPSRETPN